MSIIYNNKMTHVKLNRCVVCILFVYCLAVATCYPTGKPDPEVRNEKLFPNGTVVGKYTYLDNEGNPIHVQYYADEASYGVELKSIKMVDSSGKSSTIMYPKVNSLKAPNAHGSKPNEVHDVMNTVYPPPKQVPDDPFEYLNKEISSKINRYKPDKSNSDFEIYYQNELKGPKKYGKEKVRVYFDQDRKVRSALDHFDADKYCEQF